ncbi:MAG: hypothetical protein JRE82_15450 [Deltaproteobacteria bacterium]|nr:hypothetical protein [Deltaproteobacteria bacterium]
MQYTIRNLPARLDQLIRKRAKDEGKSLNTLVGTWVEDAAVEGALEAQRCIDDEMWR